MATLARFDPFNLVRSDPFEEMVESFMPTMLRPLRTRMQPTIPMEVMETENAYLVSAELPGIKRENINVSVSGNQLTISGESKEEKEAGVEATALCNERWFGKFSRTMTLPFEVDESGADAKYYDGILHLTLPKKASSIAKKLAIH
ncbi:MAG: Hsp20/alpha crystallin family protein [Betaproteobacteria bacterium]|nr:Hsp20/alpha crystallin family protein [Betaproteobacteria bacterium]